MRVRFRRKILNEFTFQFFEPLRAQQLVCRALTLAFALIILVAAARAQADDHANIQPTSNDSQQHSKSNGNDDVAPLVVEGANDADVFGFGRSVVVRGNVKKGAMAFGGDVFVEGVVEGDVAAIGGSVYQREGSRIGGDVMVLGGAYHHGKTAPQRNPESTTVMFAGYETELRSMMRDPSVLLAPQWSKLYFGLRVLAALLWFVASLGLTALLPGTISRAATRLQLTSTHVAVIGFCAAIVLCVGVPMSLWMLPSVIGAFVGLLIFFFVCMATLFGRVVIHAATGRWIERRFLPETNRSESLALLLGACVWTALTSLPYVWPLVVAGLLVASLGLTLTAQRQRNWVVS